MIVKIIIAVTFILIIASLGSALLHMMKYKDQPEKLAKALSYRIGLSVALFVFLFIAIVTGLLKPHGIGGNMSQSKAKSEIQAK